MCVQCERAFFSVLERTDYFHRKNKIPVKGTPEEFEDRVNTKISYSRNVNAEIIEMMEPHSANKLLVEDP